MSEVVFRSFRSNGGKRREYYVYTREEADVLGLGYVIWYDCDTDDPGRCWALSDDGHVVECHGIRTYFKRKTRNVLYKSKNYTFTVGRKWSVWEKNVATTNVWKRRHSTYLIRPFLDTEGAQMGLTMPKTWAEHELTKKNTRMAVRLYAHLFLITGGNLTEEHWTVIGQVFRKADLIPKATAKRLFKQEVVRNMAMEEMASILAGKGIDRSRVAEMIEETWREAKRANHTATMRNVYRDLITIFERADAMSDPSSEDFADESQRLEVRVSEMELLEAHRMEDIQYEEVS